MRDFVFLLERQPYYFMYEKSKKDRCERMKKLEQLYEGKAKKVFATEDPDVVIVDYKDCLLYTSDTEDIELHIESLVQGTLKTEVIPLGRLPKRGEYSMRLQIETLFLDEKTCKITVRDVGFGEFFPPTDFQEEKIIHLGGNDGKFNSMS